MSTWCDSCSIASACHQPVSDVGEAQAIVRCSDEAAGCGCGRNNFEGGSSEAVRCRFNGVYMARALAERNKRRVNLTPKKINARAFNQGNTVRIYIHFAKSLYCYCLCICTYSCIHVHVYVHDYWTMMPKGFDKETVCTYDNL